MGETINAWIEQLLDATQLEGFYLLVLTIPLAAIQGLLGLFPFTTIIMLHISGLGLVNGMLMSWLAGTVSAVAVYYLCKSILGEWFNRKMEQKLKKYEKWTKYVEEYGVWAIIFLRTLPIMPNNLITFLASISAVKPGAYWISSIVGNLSHIWLFGIISSSILMPGVSTWALIGSYTAFCIVLTAVFFAVHYRKRQRLKT
ncbi:MULTISPECIES: TVP38/TMEM64 family protein [Cohnella]|uniref:TVP38/TMEM64 family protein n=1 Tax=Cohnella TaxID=329857 RepID=UPI0009BB90E3|nr:VTT domain-containing protein [Cohnella massiliensis]MBN2984123.1 VTT domain-containing protein [Cohnella algarum]